MQMKNNGELNSVKNALKILKAFKINDHQKGVLDLADELGISKSSVHRLLKTLESEGFVTKAKNNAKYELGMSLIELNSIYLKHLDIYDVTLESMMKLITLTGETSHLAILKNDAIVYLNKLSNQQTVEVESHIGHSNYLHCTASGRVLLAYSSTTTIKRIIEQPLERFTPLTIVDAILLQKELQNTKEKGYAVVRGEYRANMTSIAVPIKNLQSKVIAALNIVAPTNRLTDEKINYYIRLLREESAKITKKIGYLSFQ